MLSHAPNLDECVCEPAPPSQLFTAMGYLQGSGQESNMSWKAVLGHDEGGYQSPALSRPYASKPANSGLSVRRRSVYPPYDLPSTAGSDSLPVHGKAASDVSTLPEDANTLGHLQSSIGRLSLQNGEGMAGKWPLGPLLEGTTEGHLQADNENSGSRNENTTGSDPIPNTPSPLSIRSHIKAQLKSPNNGMRIRRSEELGPDDTSSMKNQQTTRREYSDHFKPTIPKDVENGGNIPDHENVTSRIRHQNQIPVVRGRTMISGYGENSGHIYGSLRVLVSFYCFPSPDKSSALVPVNGSQCRKKVLILNLITVVLRAGIRQCFPKVLEVMTDEKQSACSMGAIPLRGRLRNTL